MNPIYKFEITADGVTRQVFPIYGGALEKEFAKESGQEFFRAKLSGNLIFESADYAFIVSQDFDEQFYLSVSISYDAGATWAIYWSGEFWKTDCKFDDDTQSVTVNPSVLDQYTAVLAGLDKEYNLIDLAPEIVPVRADKRPMIQVYVPGQSAIGCFLAGMWWEQDCEPESDIAKLVDDCKFVLNKSITSIDIGGTMAPQLPTTVSGESTPQTSGKYFDFVSNGVRFRRDVETNFDIISVADQNSGATWRNERVQRDLAGKYMVSVFPVEGTGASGTVTLDIETLDVFARYVCDTAQIGGVSTSEIGPDDIVPDNRNYRRIVGYNFPDTIYFSTQRTATPTKWGLYQPGQYYQPPFIYWSPELFPVARNSWGRVSVWFTFSALDWLVEQSGREQFIIRYAYPIHSVISVLLDKIAPGITHAGTTDFSQFLYGVNLIGVRQTLLITPKSNIITAGYDQPAQKAPITLRDVLDMLRDCFRCYWFVDDSGRFRIEHIEYFRNGGSYLDLPVVGFDLTAIQVPRTGKAWAYARSQYEFDKPAMAARYQFGWMDDVTELFDGRPIDIISKFVNPDNIERIQVAKFTSDIDYILLSPGEISKDGFVLLSAIPQTKSFTSTPGTELDEMAFPVNAGDIITFTNTIAPHGCGIRVGTQEVRRYSPGTYEVQVEQSGDLHVFVSLTNEDPVTITVNGGLVLPYAQMDIDKYLQNAYVSFAFLQQYYAYDMPAPDYMIGGAQMVAIGVKRLKTQSIRFPALMDPDLVKLVKTNLGSGSIEKISINLSSRNANATLKYDTE